MSTAAIYKVVWSNEHNSGELPDEYQWEVVRVDPPIPNHPLHEEKTHEHDRQD